MTNDEREIDEKLYRVVKKKCSHINTKTNPDGSRAALQFGDDNDLMGPVDLIEVDESDFVRTEYIDVEPGPRSLQQIIMEDVVVPVARDAIEQILNIGFQHFKVWMEEKAVPATNKKAKKVGENVKIIFLGVKATIKGEEPKAVKMLREKEEQEKGIVVALSMELKENDRVSDEEKDPKIELSQEEIKYIIGLMRRSAGTLVGCINLLRNAVIADTNMDVEHRIELQKQLEVHTTEDIMSEIDLLLEEKNREVLDATSLRILAAFREGKFFVDEERIPISNYISTKN